MLSLSNTLSLLRAPLAFALLIENTAIRLSAIFLAMCSDCLDGYLARKRRTTSRLGAILDPAMDKFFVFFALVLFLQEGRLQVWEACAMISRDFFLCLFAAYLSFFHLWRNYHYKSICWGKISTSMQFVTLIALAAGLTVPPYIYSLFIISGFFAFIELCRVKAS
jgi:CDP-diacylglycerol--glycerol-3-phosphate 3-phosphatidyltransferase